MAHIPETKKTILNVTVASTITIPANSMITEIVVENTTANAVTGGVKIGTTSGGVNVVAAFSCPANSLNHVASASILKKVFSKTADTTLFIGAVTLFNNANLNISFILREVF